MITITIQSNTIKVKSLLINSTDQYMTFIFFNRETSRQLRKLFRESEVQQVTINIYGNSFTVTDIAYFELKNFKDPLSISFHFKESR